MYFKKGPHNTVRAYDKRTGKYIKYNFLFDFASNKANLKEKRLLREERKREVLFYKAKKSHDKYLFDVYKAIEELSPGSVLHVNDYFYDKNINDNREIDLYLKHAIIEIKGGKSKHKFNQFNSQLMFSKYLNKEYIIYAPKMLYGTFKDANKKGFNIFNNIDDLKKYYLKCIIKKEKK